MDRASQVLAQGVPPDVPRSYRALADHGNVPHSSSRTTIDERQGAGSTVPQTI
jgi:hypothetical protein